jgi:hypothetical protein
MVQQALQCKKVINTLCRNTAQAVSHRPLIKEARFHSRTRSCGIYGGQSGTETEFL